MADTIAALSTPLGAGAICIVRMSGDNAHAIARAAFCCETMPEHAEERKLYLGTFTGEGIFDRCFLVFFYAPKSYTGEDMAEFQCHGGRKLAECILKTLIEKGARLAQKGEFTRRAFLNGKMTLDEAEGVIGMIEAESEGALLAAYRLSEGKVGKEIAVVKQLLIDAAAEMEAALDYPEEIDSQNADALLRQAKKKLNVLALSAKRGQILTDGVSVCIAGLPNRGKSSLLNALAGFERAIVTDTAGTTRDIVEHAVEHKGIKFIFSDTAGLRETTDAVENAGVVKAKKNAETADFVCIVADASLALSESEKNLLASYPENRRALIFNKCDLAEAEENRKYKALRISAKTGKGIEELLTFLTDRFQEKDAGGEILTSMRQAALVKTAEKQTEEALAKGVNDECRASLIREALRTLAQITGEDVNESVIDAVFEKFCLGK